MPSQVTLQLTWADFPALFQALSQAIGDSAKLWTVALWGRDRTLCSQLHQAWQQVFPSCQAQMLHGTADSSPDIELPPGVANLLVLSSPLAIWFQVEAMSVSGDTQLWLLLESGLESLSVRLAFDAEEIDALLNQLAIARCPAASSASMECYRETLQQFWVALWQLPPSAPAQRRSLGTKASSQTDLPESLPYFAPIGILRRATLYRQKHEQRLSADYFRLFLEKSNDIFVEYDPTLRYISINPAGCQLLRRPASAIIGKTNQELMGDAAAPIDQMIRHAVDRGEKVFFAHQFMWEGSERVFEIIYAPITNPTGTVQRVIGICRDITELKQQWQLLATRNHQLAETTRLKEEFVATTSHELRTPLTAILGFSNVLLQEFFGELNRKQKDYLERIYSSGQHLLDLINDILDLSRLEADRLELDLQMVFVPDVCEGVISLIQERAIHQGLKLAVDLDPNADWMVTDPRRLKQMLLNLLTNAVKFTQAGSVGLKVFRQSAINVAKGNPTHCGTSNIPVPTDTIHFIVWDTGIGIDEADQRSLFTPFSQIDSSLSRHHQGTGLGLVITRKLAELHGGTITLESTCNQGSKFMISLPLKVTV